MQEQFYEIHRGHVATLLKQVRRWISDEFAVTGADDDHCIDADGPHILKILVPFFCSPVLVRYVMGNFIQERSCDSKPVVFWHYQLPAIRFLVENISLFACLAGMQQRRSGNY